MKQAKKRTAPEALLEPDGVFVVHLRSDSNPRQRRLSGRIEHVMSGEVQPFGLLSEMLEFMAQHGLAPAPTKRRQR